MNVNGKVYEEDSEVDKGLRLLWKLEDKWFAQGVEAGKAGSPLCELWNDTQRAGYAYGCYLRTWEQAWQGDYSDVQFEQDREDWVGA